MPQPSTATWPCLGFRAQRTPEPSGKRGAAIRLPSILGPACLQAARTVPDLRLKVQVEEEASNLEACPKLLKYKFELGI